MARGEGTTTKQIKEAPRDALYIWANSKIFYPKALAAHLGRRDIRFIGPDSLDGGRRLRGLRRSQVVVDHAAVLDREVLEYLEIMHD